MPSGPRIRANNVYGVISDNPLTAASATFNSVSLPLLPPVVSAHAVVVFDPKRVYGDPEIVVVTAHTASSTVATIFRGQYGTSPREHPQGTAWAHVPVDEDWTEILTSSTRPSNPYQGQSIYETDTNRLQIYDGAFWRPYYNGHHAVRAVRITSNQALAANASTIAIMNSEIYDESNAYDPTTGVYTVPETGVYVITTSYRLSVDVTPFFAAITLFVNGASTYTMAANASMSTGGGNLNGVAQVRLTAGQTIDTRVFIGAGETNPIIERIDDAGVFNNLTIHRL